MKDPFEKLTKKEIEELLTKTDIPMTWVNKDFKMQKSEKKNIK